MPVGHLSDGLRRAQDPRGRLLRKGSPRQAQEDNHQLRHQGLGKGENDQAQTGKSKPLQNSQMAQYYYKVVGKVMTDMMTYYWDFLGILHFLH